MTVHVKVSGIEHTDVDWEDRPIAAVGGRVTVIVDVWFSTDLVGGKFRVTHPAIDPVEFEVAARKPTGSKPLVGKRKIAPTDLTRVEKLTCRVTAERTTDAPQAFTLVAVSNCSTESSTAHTVRVLPDDQAVAASMVLVREPSTSGTPPVLSVAKGGSTGPTSQHQNTAQAFTKFHGQFFFKDPDGVERAFPTDMPVKVLLGAHPLNAIDAKIGADGKLAIEMIGSATVIANKVLKLRFGAPADNDFVVCEVPGGSASQTLGPQPAAVDPAGNFDKRFFKLPETWTMRQADWTVTADDSRWVADPAHFKMTKDGLAASLGTPTAPVKMVLDPHWQFLKFEYFDRHYGHSDHADAPKTVAPLVVAGDRFKPLVAGTFDEDSKSNWWLKEGEDFIQCVPWIVQRGLDGTAEARPSMDTLLRFTTAARACMESTSATVRNRVVATEEQLKPGPERLKFYDLPAEWQSRNYYGKLSATAGEFGWYEEIADKPTTKAKPLVFSLDDIVLTNALGQRVATWTHADRLAIFANTFDDSLGDASKEGIYKPDAAGKLPWYTKKPAVGAPEENENYVVDRPKWARVIAAQGNLFDVFDRRTVASAPADPDYDVIGARAAVCWVDTTVQIQATTLGSWATGAWAWVPGYVPGPGRTFFPDFPTRVDQDFFSIQPYYIQEYVARFGKYLDAGSTGEIGRFDMALVRCCGVKTVIGAAVEQSINLYFHKLCFNATAHAPIGMAIDAYQVAFVRNVLDRFNGLDAKNDQGRAELLPKEPAKAIRVEVLTVLQVTPEAQAHYKISLTDSTKGGRDNRAISGVGDTGNAAPQDSGGVNGFVNAHEHGHQSALPDEYNERWDAASYGQPSFYSTLPGDPFELDGRTTEFQENDSPLMNGNHKLHNRYFWQSAEWARQVLKFELKVKLGGTYDNYWLPPYLTALEAKRHYAFWPLNPSKNDVALAVRAPLAANRGKVDLYLYAIGADAFAVKTLPGKEDPPGADPYDGILMVTLRLKVGAWGAKRTDTSDLKGLAQSLALVARRFGPRKLNHSWCIGGIHGKGTKQEWKFQRCLVHFSPRLCISGSTELETVDQWKTTVTATFNTNAVWTAVESKLAAYHAVDWEHLDKKARLTTLVGPAPEPGVAIRGTWSSTAPSTNPITAALDSFEGLPLSPVMDRYSAAEAVATACANWLSSPSAASSSSRRTGVTGVHTRATAAVNKLGALYYVRDLEEKAKAIDGHEKKVTDVIAKHAPHFTVNCKKGTPAKAEWDPMPVEGDLPEAAAWENEIFESHRSGAVFNRVKGLLTQYKEKAALDLAARITSLRALVGPATAPAGLDPRGAWSAGGKPGLAAIDTQLGLALAAAEDFNARESALTACVREVETVTSAPQTDPADATAARALQERISTALGLIWFMSSVRDLEKHAKVFLDHLERWVSSTTVTLTGESTADFEEMLLEAFPSMVGAYKQASKIGEGDIRALVSTLGLDELKVVDLREDSSVGDLGI